MFGIVQALFLRVALAGAQTSVHFISKPNIKNPSGRRAGGQRGAAFQIQETSLATSFPTFPWRGKTCAPHPHPTPVREGEAATAQSAPSGPLGDGFRPGVPPLPSHPPYPGSKYGSWTCSVRLQASPSAEPEETLAASDYTAPGGGGVEARVRPGPPHRPAGEQRGGVPRTGWPAPGEEVRQSREFPNRAPRLPARVTCSPSAAPGAARAGSGCERRKRAGRSAERRPFLFESSH